MELAITRKNVERLLAFCRQHNLDTFNLNLNEAGTYCIATTKTQSADICVAYCEAMTTTQHDDETDPIKNPFSEALPVTWLERFLTESKFCQLERLQLSVNHSSIRLIE